MRKHSQYPKEAGIYKITSNITGKIYIGKSVNIYNRIASHKSATEDGHLHNAIRKYGWDSFSVEILEIFEDFRIEDNETLLQREAFYINLFESANRDIGYNICEFSNDRTGVLASNQTKEKMRNKIVSEETREKMRKSMLGKTHTKETREKMSKARMGMVFSESTKEKMSNWVRNDETREKIRQANLGRKHSEETKKKMRDAKLGCSKSEETKEKMRKPKSASHRENIRLSWIKRKHEKKISQEHA